MDVLRISKITAILSTVPVSVVLGITLMDFDTMLVRQDDAISQTITEARNTTHAASLAITEYERAGHDLRLTLDNVNKAAIDERMFYEQQVPQYNRELHAILQTTDKAAAGVTPVTVAATEAIHTLNNQLAATGPTIAAATTTLGNVNQQILDLNPTIVQAQSTMQHLDGAAAELQTTASDLRKGVERTQHGWLYRVFTRVF